jgi:hypothetical protein
MTQKPLDSSKPQSVLKNVREGMEVYDSNGEKVGSVRTLYFGADSDEMRRYGAGAATAPNPNMREDSLVEDVAEAIFTDNDDLPKEMRQRLVNEGYLRIDTAGLFRSDRFVFAEQIAAVRGDQVHLKVSREDLLEEDAAME